jgi:hypothetical protein
MRGLVVASLSGELVDGVCRTDAVSGASSYDYIRRGGRPAIGAQSSKVLQIQWRLRLDGATLLAPPRTEHFTRRLIWGSS